MNSVSYITDSDELQIALLPRDAVLVRFRPIQKYKIIYWCMAAPQVLCLSSIRSSVCLSVCHKVGVLSKRLNAASSKQRRISEIERILVFRCQRS